MKVGQEEVHESQVRRDEKNQDQDHPGGAQGLFAVGPGGFLQLLDRFHDKALGLGPIELDRRNLTEPPRPRFALLEPDHLPARSLAALFQVGSGLCFGLLIHTGSTLIFPRHVNTPPPPDAKGKARG